MITHNPERNRFETTVDGCTAHVEYVIEAGYIDIIHTIVPKQIGGRGIAADLVKETYNYGKEHGLEPKATCEYAVTWLKREASKR